MTFVEVSIKESAPKLYYKCMVRPGGAFMRYGPGETFSVHASLVARYEASPDVFVVGVAPSAPVVESPAPEAPVEPSAPVALDRTGMKKSELAVEAKAAGIEVKGLTKVELIAALEES